MINFKSCLFTKKGFFLGKKESVVLICLFFLIFLIPTCSSLKSYKFGDIKQKGDTIEGTGTIRYLEIEGGFYGIETSEKHYDPINLPSEFKKDGLRIRFKAKLRKDLMSFRMWGSLVELVYIKKFHNKEIP